MTNEPLGYMILPTKAAQEWRLIAQHHTPDWGDAGSAGKHGFWKRHSCDLLMPGIALSPAAAQTYVPFRHVCQTEVGRDLQLYPDWRLV